MRKIVFSFVKYGFLLRPVGWQTVERLCCSTTVSVWHSCRQYSHFDRVILLSVECPVICQMQQLLVSMATTRGPFSVFSSSLCGAKTGGGRRRA